MEPGNNSKACPSCGAANDTAASVCNVCGSDLNAPYSSPPGPTSFTQAPGPPAGVDTNKMIVTLLLWFFLGTLGLHRLYIGHTQTGIIMLVLSVVGWATSCIVIGWIPLAAVAVWWFVDIFLIITGSLRPTDGSRLV